MDLALYLLLFLHLHRLAPTFSAAAELPMMFPSAACSDQLVIFSSCLPFIGASPSNQTEFPPPQCCDDVAAVFGNGSAICLCYLILEPDILGFPLNSSKLLSLTSFCPRSDQNLDTNFSLEKLCSAESPPPQESSGGPSTEETADDDSLYRGSSSTPSSATQKIHRLLFILIFFLLFSISYLQ